MATHQPTILLKQTSDAEFRNWVNAIVTAFTTLGWIDAAETGQIYTSTATFPNAANLNKGFKMFRMNDSLQGTYPVFCKMEFGSGAAANDPAMRMTVGTATDGAGTLSGTVGASLAFGNIAAASAASLTQYFSGDTDRIAGLVRITSAAATGIVFFCERLRASDGTASADGVVYGMHPCLNTITWTTTDGGGMQVLEWGKAVPTKFSFYWNALAHPNATTMTSGGDTYLFPIIPIGWKSWNPIIGFGAYLAVDIANMATFNTTTYGTSRLHRAIASEVYSTNTKFGLLGISPYPYIAEW